MVFVETGPTGSMVGQQSAANTIGGWTGLAGAAFVGLVVASAANIVRGLHSAASIPKGPDTVSAGADKKLTAEFYSIDQTTDPLPVDSISFEGKSVKFALPMIHGSFDGTLSANSNSIDGTWTQGSSNLLKFERATKSTAWAIDPSKHTVQFVTVEPGVKLEVLDWGGTGRPMVLLTGLGTNAHIFDGFRRELSSIGSRFPTRVAGPVYLDAGYPHALYDATHGDFGLDGIALREKMTEPRMHGIRLRFADSSQRC